ncbi:glycosyl hydrolase family 76-domain-containing protein [Usnea florida]
MRLISSAGRSRSSWLSTTALSLLAGTTLTSAISLDLTDPNSIKSAAATCAYNLLTFYTGNHTGDVPGNLPQPYYWWEAGGMFGTLIDYYYYTNDSQYNDLVTQAMLWQVGPDNDYMTPNQTKTEGNDDQGFWGMAAMSAAEQKFPDPPSSQPQWLALAQAVFNDQASRWDTQYCNGGLRWQIFTFNTGYDYKNSISNGCFFNLGARLALYTGNDTYAQWAAKTFNWTQAVSLMDQNYHFYDGAHTTLNCSDINRVQWTYNSGVYLLGASVMYNYTNGSALWQERVMGILNATSIFFTTNPPNVMYEVACEPVNTCDTDNYSFKAYLARWLVASIKYAPFIQTTVMPWIQASATAAAQQCSGGANGQMCGMKWTMGSTWDGSQGVGQQMGALSVIQANLIDQVAVPVTNKTGGTSQGNAAAGGGGGISTSNPALSQDTITQGSKAGAGILTFLVLTSVMGCTWWMIA